jgi:UPF0755 protein
MNVRRFFQLAFGVLVFFVGIGVFVVALLGWQSYRFFFSQPSEGAEVIAFVIEEGEGFSEITEALHVQGLIANRSWFRIYAWLDGSARSLQSGTFSLQPNLNYAAIIDALGHSSAEEIEITIPEGTSLKKIGELLVQQFDFTLDDWEIATGTSSPLFSLPFFLTTETPDGVDLEGYLFPETYRFFPDATAEDIAGRMVAELESRLAEENIVGTSEMSVHEIITLASVLEREVQHPSDYANVADVFLKRIDIDMPLQSDATVSYAEGNESSDIFDIDREIDSPYNTYMYRGLPLGPICNPGMAAILAVLHPTPNDYYYFLTTSENDVVYAETYEEHLVNKAKYLP